MTVREALISLTTYPVPVNYIDKLCIDRGITASAVYTDIISVSDGFRLATADVYMFLFGAPSLKEQEISVSVDERKNYQMMANKIYGDLQDAAFTGTSYGCIGDDFNR